MVSVERQLNRIPKKLLITVEGATCIMENMSQTGMRLISPVLFKKQTVNIFFQMDNFSIELKGTIRWMQKKSTVYDQPQYQVGVFLPDPPPKYIRLIEKMLEGTD
jgi:hypothetical protein